MEKEIVSTRKIKLIARHYGKGRLVRQCISCFALLINVFTWWWNNETTRREARSDDPKNSIVFYDKELGKTVFLTKKEAETKLGDIRSGEDV